MLLARVMSYDTMCRWKLTRGRSVSTWSTCLPVSMSSSSPPPVCVCVSLCALGSLSCLSSKPEIYSLTSVFSSLTAEVIRCQTRAYCTQWGSGLECDTLHHSSVWERWNARCTDKFKEFTRSENDHLASCIVLVSWLVSLNPIRFRMQLTTGNISTAHSSTPKVHSMFFLVHITLVTFHITLGAPSTKSFYKFLSSLQLCSALSQGFLQL